MVGLHQHITLSFLPVGHTKFATDACFGLIKQRFRHTRVDCIDDLARLVERSSNVNIAQPVGNQLTGERIVPLFNWHNYLQAKFRKLSHIKQIHKFVFSSDCPGTVKISEFSNTDESTITLLRDATWSPSPAELPQLLYPSGLSNERQWYLYEKIRDFCSDDTKDIVCPLPCMPRSSATPLPSPSRPTISFSGEEPPTKKQRVCGNCGRTGHYRNTCNITM